MTDNEARLMSAVLEYEEGHRRRTEHILAVYALSQLLGFRHSLPEDQKRLLSAAAILHDIAIKTCKEKYGDACLENQKRELPRLIRRFMEKAGYRGDCIAPVTYLALNHHGYDSRGGIIMDILMQADLTVNALEEGKGDIPCPGIFESSGQWLMDICRKAGGK